MKRTTLFAIPIALAILVSFGGIVSASAADTTNMNDLANPKEAETSTDTQTAAANTSYHPLDETLTLANIDAALDKECEMRVTNLRAEAESILEDIPSFDSYTNNLDKVEAFYQDAADEVTISSITLKEYAAIYAELLLASTIDGAIDEDQLTTFCSTFGGEGERAYIVKMCSEIQDIIDNFHTSIVDGPLSENADNASSESRDRALINEADKYFKAVNRIDYLSSSQYVKTWQFSSNIEDDFDFAQYGDDDDYFYAYTRIDLFVLAIENEKEEYGLPSEVVQSAVLQQKLDELQQEKDRILTMLNKKDAEAEDQHKSDPYTEKSYQQYLETSASVREMLDVGFVGWSTLSKAEEQFESAASLLIPLSSYERYSANDLARRPDTYTDANIVITGLVAQVEENDSYNAILLSTEDDSTGEVIVVFEPNLLDFRILKGDTLTVYGVFDGLTDYLATEDSASLPTIFADEIDLLSK